MSRLDEFAARHKFVENADENGGVPTSVWEEFVDDHERLITFAKAVRDATASGKDILAHGAEIDTDFPDLVSRLGAALHELENPS